MSATKADHVIFKFDSNQLLCTHCGETYPVTMPVSVNMFAAMGKAFGKSHRGCKPRKEGP